MYFKIRCPHCSARLKVPEKDRGTTAVCPLCTNEIELIEEMELVDVVGAAPANRASPAAEPPPVAAAWREPPVQHGAAPPPYMAPSYMAPSYMAPPYVPPAHAAPAEQAGPPENAVAAPAGGVRRSTVSVVGQPVPGLSRYSGKPNGTNVSFFAAGLLALPAFAGYFALIQALRNTYVGRLVLDGGWVNHAIIFLTLWTAAMLMLKSRKVKRQRASLGLDLLPASISPAICRENLDRFQEHVRTCGGDPKHSFLVSRVLRAIEYFKARGNVEEVTGTLRAQADVDVTGVDSSYAMIRVFIWAIPILGFIGTVVGISAAVSNFSDSLQAAQDLDVIKQSLGMVTSNLAYAFNTTLVALVMSVLLMIPSSSMQKSEEDLLNSVDGYCNEHLLQRLAEDPAAPPEEAEASPQAAAAAQGVQAVQQLQLEQWSEQLKAVGSALTQAVLDGWQEVQQRMEQSQAEQFSAAAGALQETARQVHQQVLEASQAGVRDHQDVVAQLAGNLRELQEQSHRQHQVQAEKLAAMAVQLGENLVEVQGGLAAVQGQFSETLAGLGPCLQEEVRKFAAEVDAALEKKTQPLAGVIASIENHAATYAVELRQFQESYLAAMEQASRAAAAVVARTGQEVSTSREVIEASQTVARKLDEANTAARRTIDELVGCFAKMSERHQDFSLSQRSLAARLEQMVTTEAFGSMLAGMNKALRGLVAVTCQLEEQVEELVAGKAAARNRFAWLPWRLFARSDDGNAPANGGRRHG